MSNKANKYDSWRRYAGLVIVVFVVLGISIVSVFAERNNPATDDKRQTKDDKRQELENSEPRPALMVIDESGIHLLGLNGSSTRDIKWPDDISRLGQPLSQINGVDVQTGQAAWLDAGFIKAASTVFRAPDGRHDARMTDARGDGAGAIMLTQGGNSQLLVLRQKNGRVISNAQLLGWIDKNTMAIMGVATSSRNIFSFDTNGVLTPFSYLPDDAWLIKVSPGSVYYALATPGEGIESPQMPPSSIWRVSLNGEAEAIVEEPLRVIQNFVIADDGIAYGTDDGIIKSVVNGNVSDLGKGRLVSRIAGQGVLIVRDNNLILVKDDGDSVSLNLNLKSAVFYLSQAVLGEINNN